MRFLPFLVAVGLVTCTETVRLDDGARTVEFIGHEHIATYRDKCREIGTFEVSTIPAEISREDRLDVLEIKAKNEGRKLGATHVLLWPGKEWACDKDGTENPESQRTCSNREGTAYECVMGRRP